MDAWKEKKLGVKMSEFKGAMDMKVKMKELPQECPFCHDIPSVVKNALWNNGHGYYGNHEYYVACTNVNCKVQPKTKAYNDIYDLTEQECIEKSINDWNSR